MCNDSVFVIELDNKILGVKVLVYGVVYLSHSVTRLFKSLALLVHFVDRFRVLNGYGFANRAFSVLSV